MTRRDRLLLALLNAVPLLLFLVVFAVFGAISPHFLDARNLVNILVQSSSLAIVATGMTFVILTAGIDLSVGAVMFLSAAVAGKMVLAGLPLPLACLAVVVIGAAVGLVNAALVVRFRVIPFIATLATLYIGRGLALYLTETRAMNLPDSIVILGAGRALGVPLPVWILAFTLALAHFTLRRTPFGRQIYAVGNDPRAAARAGIDNRRVLLGVYLIGGICAALGGLVAVAQLGAVSPTFGYQREFAAIAAAVLGGASLFGGRGSVLPGTLIGAALIQTVESGMVIVNADPYLYPLVTALIIFLAVVLDCVRHQHAEKLRLRRIRA
jgi:ribose transport system permease protein